MLFSLEEHTIFGGGVREGKWEKRRGGGKEEEERGKREEGRGKKKEEKEKKKKEKEEKKKEKRKVKKRKKKKRKGRGKRRERNLDITTFLLNKILNKSKIINCTSIKKMMMRVIQFVKFSLSFDSNSNAFSLHSKALPHCLL